MLILHVKPCRLRCRSVHPLPHTCKAFKRCSAARHEPSKVREDSCLCPHTAVARQTSRALTPSHQHLCTEPTITQQAGRALLCIAHAMRTLGELWGTRQAGCGAPHKAGHALLLLQGSLEFGSLQHRHKKALAHSETLKELCVRSRVMGRLGPGRVKSPPDHTSAANIAAEAMLSAA